MKLLASAIRDVTIRLAPPGIAMGGLGLGIYSRVFKGSKYYCVALGGPNMRSTARGAIAPGEVTSSPVRNF